MEKELEAAQQDLDRFGKTPGRGSPTVDKEFECPICLETMGPPRQIFQCPIGHLICDLCMIQADQGRCHVCRAQLSGGFTRNLAMERVVRAYLAENSQ